MGSFGPKVDTEAQEEAELRTEREEKRVSEERDDIAIRQSAEERMRLSGLRGRSALTTAGERGFPAGGKGKATLPGSKPATASPAAGPAATRFPSGFNFSTFFGN
ncbi:MAG: hypothetical protein JKY34_08745 [Kordiimonadaceae bacterium]|nr:hypothetical protein [Kordiimonadaceae bacterium]